MAFTVVSFHAHPDDEVLMTGGTLAKAAADGHRVVLVVATNGEAGLAATGLMTRNNLGQLRSAEVHRSAEILGCARVVMLGYQDSGLHGDRKGPRAFSRVDPKEIAHRLAAILLEENAHVLTIYDPAGGYGHPDHCQVHQVGVLAAALARTPVVLEATADRTLFRWLARLVALVPGGLGGLRREDLAAAYSDRASITHRVNVRAHLGAKRLAMQAHTSQATSGEGADVPRTLAMLLRLPQPLFGLLLGQEWFVEHGRRPGRYSGDIFASIGCDREPDHQARRKLLDRIRMRSG
jgi:LmbE family N-acetylglucosaminyl deacetylase